MVTQRDIANELGVSVPLVSRVLSGKAKDIGIADATIERIQETAESMGYRANLQARMLRGGDVQTLGVVVSDFEDPFLGHFLKELEAYARSIGYSLLVESRSANTSTPKDGHLFPPQSISRMVILGSQDNLDWTCPLIAAHIPVTQVGSGPDIRGLNRIEMDHDQGYRLLLTYLRDQGVRSAAYLGPVTGARSARADAFVRACNDLELQRIDHPAWQINTVEYRAGAAAMTAILSAISPALPDAVITVNDQVAIGALSACHRHAVKIPDQLRIAGFDDIPMAAYTQPGLTTLRQPVDDMIRILFEQILADRPARHTRIPAKLVQRATA